MREGGGSPRTLVVGVGTHARHQRCSGLHAPIWALLVHFRVGYDLDIWPLAVVGAVGATMGRFMLALLKRSVGERIVPRRWRANISALTDIIRSRRALSMSSLGLFALGPVPSNHLFIAAGLANTPLAPVLAVFASARFFSYVFWITVGTTAAQSLRDVISPRLGNGVAIVMQLVGFVVLILVMQVDWASRLKRWGRLQPAVRES